MSQKGLTFVDLLLGLAIGGVLLAVVVPATHQMMRSTPRITGMSTALSDIDRATHWLSRDARQAQTTNLVSGDTVVTQMTLTGDDLTAWATASGDVNHAITYTHSGTELQRDVDGQISSVGRYLTSVEFSISGRVLTVALTSSPDSFLPRPSVSRTFTIRLRPG